MNLNAAIVISAVDKTGAAFRSVMTQSRGLESHFQRVAQNIGRFGRNMTLGITAPLALAARSALKTAGDLQAELKYLEVTSGATAAQMARVAKQAEEIGTATIFSNGQVAQSYQMLISNGVAIEDVLNGVGKGTVNLAAATREDLALAAKVASDAFNAFDISAANSDAAMNTITGTLLQSKMKLDDFGLALSAVGGTTGDLKVPFREFAAVMAATASSFSGGSDAGTSYKTFLLSLAGSSKQAKQAMKELGLEFFDAAGNLKSMPAIAEQLKKGLGGLTDESLLRAMQTIFGTDGMRMALALMGEGEEGLKRMMALIGKSDAAKQGAALMTGYNGELEKFNGSIDNLKIKLANSGLMEHAIKLIEKLGGWADWLAAQPDAVKSFAVGAGALAAAIGPVSMALGGLVRLAGGTIKFARAIGLLAANTDKLATASKGLAGSGFLGLGSGLAAMLLRLGLPAAALGVTYKALEATPPADPSLTNADRIVERENWHRKFGAVPFEGGMHRAGLYDGERSGPAPGSWAASQAVTQRTVEAQGRILDGLKGVVAALKILFKNGMPIPGAGGAPGLGGSLGGVGGAPGGGGRAWQQAAIDTSRDVMSGRGSGTSATGAAATFDAESSVEAALRYINGAAVRKQKLTGTLEEKIVKAVGAVYGPGARADVYSGGQPATGLARVGSTRHDKGHAGDFYIYDAKGNRITGDRLAPLAQYWQANKFGGTGLEMRGGGIHLDEHADRAPYWSYGTMTKAQLAAIQAGRRGELPPNLYTRKPTPEQEAAGDFFAEVQKLKASTSRRDEVFSPSFRTKDRLEMGHGEVSVRLKLDKGLTADRTRLKQPENFSLGVGVDKTGEPGWNPPRVRERV